MSAALPSLSLPKQRTHWSVGVVIAAAVLFLIMGAALYAVLQRQQAAEEAYAKRQADRTTELKAEAEKAKAEKAKAEAERAAAEAKKKEAETTAAAATAAQKKAAAASADDDAAKARRRAAKKGGGTKTASKGGAAPPTSPTAAPAKSAPSTKASRDIDDLLKSFK